jgi:hypothetical protein
MVLDWLSKSTDVTQLIAKKRYARAIEVLSEQLAHEVGNPRVRLQLADVLVMAGRPLDAVPVLMEVADLFAGEGQAAKAIAALKKIERLAPGRRDVESRLASLIKGGRTAAPVAARPSAWVPREGQSAVGSEAAGAVFSASDFEPNAVVSDEDRIAAAKNASWTPSFKADEEKPMEIPAIPPPSPGAPEPEITLEPDAGITDAVFQSQMLDVISQALKKPPAAKPAPPATAPGGIADSPLFSSFSQDELVAVMRGLRLLSFEPGDIIISEGDAGDSLFVITTGVAKAFVRRDGRQALARQMGEGTFFGEISILSGKPRTATVTAAAPCELLELDRATLDEITKSHPNVKQVLEDFYIQRASGQPG